MRYITIGLGAPLISALADWVAGIITFGYFLCLAAVIAFVLYRKPKSKNK